MFLMHFLPKHHGPTDGHRPLRMYENAKYIAVARRKLLLLSQKAMDGRSEIFFYSRFIVYMYISMYTHAHTRTHTRAPACTYAYLHTCAPAHTRRQARACNHACVHTHPHTQNLSHTALNLLVSLMIGILLIDASPLQSTSRRRYYRCGRPRKSRISVSCLKSVENL